MKSTDEPLFECQFDDLSKSEYDAIPVRQRIGCLLQAEPFAVLCTQGQGQPYGSLVAYAFSDDLQYAVFATSKATRKYRLLTECSHVALVIDSRSRYGDELMKIEAITATGKAEELPEGDQEPWRPLLIKRHPYIETFIQSGTTALFRIKIFRYLHVSRFQEVHQWIPQENG